MSAISQRILYQTLSLRQSLKSNQKNITAIKTILIPALIILQQKKNLCRSFKLSAYVDEKANNDAINIGILGFEPTKVSERRIKGSEHAKEVTLERGISRELISECEVVKDAEFYGAILLADKPLPAGFYLPE